MSWLHLKAIVIGLLVGLSFSVFAPQVLVFLIGSELRSTPPGIWALVLGGIATTLGAFFTARHSLSQKAFNVLIYGAVNELLGYIFLIFFTYPLWYNTASAMIVIAGCTIGWLIERLLK